MADKKISQFTSLASGDIDSANDVLAIVDATGPTTKKVTVAALVGAPITAGSGITVTKSSSSVTIASSGDLLGPASSLDNALPRFDGTTGKILQGSQVYIDDSNRMVFGKDSVVSLTATITPQFQQLGGTINTSAFMAARYSANASMTWYYTAKSRNATVGSHTVLQDNDGLGGIAMFGSDGTNFVAGAEIYGEVNGTPSTGSMPSDIVFRVNSVEKFRIFNDGVLSDDKGNLRAVPQSGAAKTGSYTLVKADIGRYIHVGSGGSVTIPDALFEAGDIVSVFNNTSGNITITCTITTAYIAGTDSDKASVTLATRGVATILFISGTTCVISGNVT